MLVSGALLRSGACLCKCSELRVVVALQSVRRVSRRVSIGACLLRGVCAVADVVATLWHVHVHVYCVKQLFPRKHMFPRNIGHYSVHERAGMLLVHVWRFNGSTHE